MNPATLVRLKSDPGRRGMSTGKSRTRGGRLLWQITFQDGVHYVPEKQLEVVPTEMEAPIDLLAEGKFGRARDLRSTITHIRLNGRLADLIYSMEITNTDFYPYQFKPVLNFLESPSNGLLIADEVGLGKTIEAGLIWTELRSRFDLRNLMILCPAMLREKWRLELMYRFGVEADIVDAKELLQVLQEYKVGIRDRVSVICSMQGLRPNKGWTENDKLKTNSVNLARFLNENAHDEPLIDLLVVDEAHYMRNPESMTSQLGRLLRGVTGHIVLLSATPIHLKSHDLYQLLNLVDEDSFNQIHVFDDILEANEPLIKARDAILGGLKNSSELIDLLRSAQEFPLLSESRQLRRLLEMPPSNQELEDKSYTSKLANRLENINLLGKAVTRTRKREVTEWRVIREAVAEKVVMTELEQNFYEVVTGTIREYCLKREAHEGFLLVMPQRQISSSMPAALREWQRRRPEFSEQLYEDLGIIDDNNSTKNGPLVQEIIDHVESFGDLKELMANDSKYNRLSSILKAALRTNPKEKIVLFAYFRPTLLYLEERLTHEGIKCVTLMGGVEDKYKIIEQFKKTGGPSVLLASEVASEGIDLQFARVVINYDLPWNPMKVEQRIGRIDRLGQKAPKIYIWNLFYQDTIDERIYERLYARLDIFERALGGLEAILGDKIQSLTLELLRGDLTPQQEEERILQTAQAVANLRENEENLEGQANNLVAHGEYILHQVRAAKELGRWVSGEDLWTYVGDYLKNKYPGCQFKQLKEGQLIFDIILSEKARFDFGVYLQATRMTGQSKLAGGSIKPVRCNFTNQVGKQASGRAEVINQFHPLIRYISNQIRESISQQEIIYYPNVSVQLASHTIPRIPVGTYAFYVENWSVKGVRSIEKIVYFARRIESPTHQLEDEDAEQLITTAARYGEDWPAATNVIDLGPLVEVVEECMEIALNRYEEFIMNIENENNDRADMQIKSAQLHLARQIAKFEEIISNLEKKGHTKMIAPTLGRQEKVKERVDHKLLDIEKKRKLQHHNKAVSLGVVRVH